MFRAALIEFQATSFDFKVRNHETSEMLENLVTIRDTLRHFGPVKLQENAKKHVA